MQRVQNRTGLLLFTVFCSLCLARLIANAWVAEDAYITFRVIDNFINGYGLRWNIDERVQVYTHPLWMLLHIPFQWIIGNPYPATILLSLVCAVGAVYVLTTLRPEAPLWQKALLVVLPLTLSRSFVDFAVSGLENPLSALLLALILREWLRPEAQFKLYRFGFLIALFLLTRLDNVILLLPVLCFVAYARWRELRFGKAVFAASPLLGWFAFSIIYYGFFFPNTKYAKLNTGIPLSDYMVQGWHYITVSLVHDFFGAVLIVCGLLIAGIYHARRVIGAHDMASLKLGLLFLGGLCHIAYVLTVGGDFMAGRFFVNLIVLSAAILYVTFEGISQKLGLRIAFLAMTVSLIAIFVMKPLMPDPADYMINHGIVDERAFYEKSTGLFSDKDHLFRRHPTNISAIFWRWPGDNGISYEIHGKRDHQFDGQTFMCSNIGMIGYYLGPGVTFIDALALTDHFLTHMPLSYPESWRIGHFIRPVPTSYWVARENGDTSLMDEETLVFYRNLRQVTSGELFNYERIVAIIGFQLGLYDHLMEHYSVKNTPES